MAMVGVDDSSTQLGLRVGSYLALLYIHHISQVKSHSDLNTVLNISISIVIIIIIVVQEQSLVILFVHENLSFTVCCILHVIVNDKIRTPLAENNTAHVQYCWINLSSLLQTSFLNNSIHHFTAKS